MSFSKCLLLIPAILCASPCATVRGDHILGRDLAAVRPPFAALDPELPLSLAPMAGAARVFPPGELNALAQRYGIALSQQIQSVCFALAMEALSADRLRPVLETALGSPAFTLIGFATGKFPPGDLRFQRSSLEPSGLWRGHIVEGSRNAAVWARIKIDGDVSGTPVARGDTLQVEVRSGMAVLRFSAPAQTSARVGELVLLRNPATDRLFQAKALGGGRAAVNR